MVLLKGFGADGFRFFTNYESAKGAQIEARPVAALVFYWRELDRQVSVAGRVERVGDAESDVHAARAAGCRAVLVRTGRGQAAVAALSARGGLDEVLVAADLPAAVELLLGGGAD